MPSTATKQGRGKGSALFVFVFMYDDLNTPEILKYRISHIVPHIAGA